MKVQEVGGVCFHIWGISSNPSLQALLKAGGHRRPSCLITSHVALINLSSAFTVPSSRVDTFVGDGSRRGQGSGQCPQRLGEGASSTAARTAPT